MSESTNKVNEFGHFRKNLVIITLTLSTSAKVCPFLKRDVHRRFLFLGTATAPDTLHKVFGRFPLVRCRSKISFLVFISSRQHDQ